MERKSTSRIEPEILWGAWSRLEQFFATTRTRPDAPAPSAASTPGLVAPNAEAPRVLVAEDNPSLQVLTCRILAGMGVKAQLAVNGAEAVDLACASEFDLILMDLQMPVLDGFGATRRIRLHEREHARPRVPVVAYTSCPYGPNEPFLLDLGIDAVLQKPCSPRALHECLVTWITPRRAAGQLGGADRDARGPLA
jgi:CheY-like chemotaxis protein